MKATPGETFKAAFAASKGAVEGLPALLRSRAKPLLEAPAHAPEWAAEHRLFAAKAFWECALGDAIFPAHRLNDSGVLARVEGLLKILPADVPSEVYGLALASLTAYEGYRDKRSPKRQPADAAQMLSVLERLQRGQALSEA